MDVGLRCGCDNPLCNGLIESTFDSLRRGVRGDAAAMVVDDAYQPGSTFRRRTRRAWRLGYFAAPIDRTMHVDEIHAINTSAPERQGRPMTEGYVRVPSYSTLPYGCPNHRVSQYGVRDKAGTLVAYAYIYRVGELRLVSSILGHASALRDDVMYALMDWAIFDEPHGVWVYGEWASGTDGLRYFKSKLGFAPTPARFSRA